jgi:hypothetical protein
MMSSAVCGRAEPPPIGAARESPNRAFLETDEAGVTITADAYQRGLLDFRQWPASLIQKPGLDVYRVKSNTPAETDVRDGVPARGVEPPSLASPEGPERARACSPRGLTVEGNSETRRRLERAGVEMRVYRGRELSKGDGGPTCLTFPLARSSVDSQPSRSS